MTAIANEPRPSPGRGLFSALRVMSLGEAASALWTAWHLATLRGNAIGPGVRARSLALVLSAAALLGVGGSLAAASAVRIAQRAITQEQGEVRTHQSGSDEQGHTTQTAVPQASGAAHAGTANPNISQADTDQPNMGEGDAGQAGAGGAATHQTGTNETTTQEPSRGVGNTQEPGPGGTARHQQGTAGTEAP